MLVNLELDAWEVSGQVHVRPGAHATDQVLRGTREMVPLTEVQVASREHSGTGTTLPVIVVNRRHVRRIMVDQPHASGPVAEPVDEGAVALRLQALGVAPETVEAAEVPEVASAELEVAAAEPAIDSAGDIVHGALRLLLDVGVIDLAEFQSMRARVGGHKPD